MSTIDSREFRRCCGRFATGVTIVTTEVDGERHGMTANGFMSVSLDPPLILVSVGKKAKTHALLSKSKSYGLSVLAEDQINLSNHFAGQPQPDLEIPWESFHENWVMQGSLAKFSAKIVDAHDAGDHTLFIAEVIALEYTDGDPLTYYYTGYSSLILYNPSKK